MCSQAKQDACKRRLISSYWMKGYILSFNWQLPRLYTSSTQPFLVIKSVTPWPLARGRKVTNRNCDRICIALHVQLMPNSSPLANTLWMLHCWTLLIPFCNIRPPAYTQMTLAHVLCLPLFNVDNPSSTQMHDLPYLTASRQKVSDLVPGSCTCNWTTMHNGKVLDLL